MSKGIRHGGFPVKSSVIGNDKVYRLNRISQCVPNNLPKPKGLIKLVFNIRFNNKEIKITVRTCESARMRAEENDTRSSRCSLRQGFYHGINYLLVHRQGSP